MSVIDDFTVDAVRALPTADLIQFELAEIDASFHQAFGQDEAGWLPRQVAAYNSAIGAVWAACGERAA